MYRSNIQNVILISIDQLSFRKTKLGGHLFDACPTINALADHGLACTRAYVHGYPTMFSYPSIFTSTLPFDHGGPDYGILYRPRSIVEVLSAAGLRTIGITQDQRQGSFLGFDRGFDEFTEVFDIIASWLCFYQIYHPYYLSLWRNGQISDEEYARSAFFREHCIQFILLCDAMEQQKILPRHPLSVMLYRHDFLRMKNMMLREVEAYDADPIGYLSGRLEQFSREFNSLCADSLRPFYTPWSARYRRLRLRLGAPVSGSGGNCPIPGHEGIDLLSTPDAHPFWLIEDAIRRNARRPFFIWYHAGDVHSRDASLGAHSLPPGYWQDLLQRLRHGRRHLGWSQAYDACVRAVDARIRGVVDLLRRLDVLDSTLLVITADHGTRWDVDGHAGHFELSENNARVPLIFYSPSLPRARIDKLVAAIDIAPTILEIMRLPSNQDFQGHSVLDSDFERSHIITESSGSGPSDLARKALRICVTTKKHKLVWVEADRYAPVWANSSTCSTEVVPLQLYDLDADPGETRNMIRDSRYSAVRSSLEEIARRRCMTIRADTRTYNYPHSGAALPPRRSRAHTARHADY